MQKSSGIAPIIEQSGKKSWTHWRYAYTKFIRQTFVEWAAQTIPRSFWAKAFYDSYRARGGRHQAALRALALQMDPYPPPLLARPHPLRRITLLDGPAETLRTLAQARRARS